MRDDVGSPRPLPRLRLLAAAAIIVGVVLGVGIFRALALVAVEAEAGGTGLWGLGGALALICALCCARARGGQSVAFLFAWARRARSCAPLARPEEISSKGDRR